MGVVQDEHTLSKEERIRLFPNLPEKSKVWSYGNPEPLRVTEWAPGYDILGQPPDRSSDGAENE